VGTVKQSRSHVLLDRKRNGHVSCSSKDKTNLNLDCFNKQGKSRNWVFKLGRKAKQKAGSVGSRILVIVENSPPFLGVIPK
jgi:chorismate synthase